MKTPADNTVRLTSSVTFAAVTAAEGRVESGIRGPVAAMVLAQASYNAQTSAETKFHILRNTLVQTRNDITGHMRSPM